MTSYFIPCDSCFPALNLPCLYLQPLPPSQVPTTCKLPSFLMSPHPAFPYNQTLRSFAILLPYSAMIFTLPPPPSLSWNSPSSPPYSSLAFTNMLPTHPRPTKIFLLIPSSPASSLNPILQFLLADLVNSSSDPENMQSNQVPNSKAQ